jgi:hypothetical protein
MVKEMLERRRRGRKRNPLEGGPFAMQLRREN